MRRSWVDPAWKEVPKLSLLQSSGALGCHRPVPGPCQLWDAQGERMHSGVGNL